MAAEPQVVFADLVDADPPLRELTTTARRSIAPQAPSASVVMPVLLVVLPSALLPAIVPGTEIVIYLLCCIVGAVALGWWTAGKRARVRQVIVHGTQQSAQINGVSHLVV